MSTLEHGPAPVSDWARGWPPFRVLCVDDNRDCADSAALLLKTMGFESQACYDGPSALLLNETFRPGVCFLDLNMPGMDGDQVALRPRMQTGWRPLLLIAMTAMSNDAARTRIVTAGFDMHLVKPVDPQKLMEVVDLLFRVAESVAAPTTTNTEVEREAGQKPPSGNSP